MFQIGRGFSITNDQQRCFVIAEAGVNHNGSLDMARDMIEAAVNSGADAIKFQSYSTDRLVTASIGKASYQKETTGDGNQADMLRALELSKDDTRVLNNHCGQCGIEFMSTPFDPDILEFLAGDLGMKRVKIPSGEAVNGPLLLAAVRTGLPVLLSTGMCDLEDVMESLSILAWGAANSSGVPSGRGELSRLRDGEDWLGPLRDTVWLMHCVSEYPAPADSMNLLAMDVLSDATEIPVGLSDHSTGYHVALAAVARGACVIEKHFTLSRDLEGPDHKASLEVDELAAMVREIRDVEQALGNYEKNPNAAEKQNAIAARGNLVASAPIAAGSPFTPENLIIKRAGGGASALEYFDYVAGKTAARDYDPDDPID